ncbi:efflux RND transporter permease subunit [Marinilabiliaceae bacterium JC017]|nr:efflux RND transporter permease subunit [Marinilabiliaceae bacterium JC017]
MKVIARFSVNYPVTVFMIVLGVVLLGAISLSRLGTDLFPDLQNPRLYVEIKSGERPPEEIETRFVEAIEALAIRQSGVMNVSSVSQVGAGQVTVDYTWSKDMDEAYLDLQKALATISQDPDMEAFNITRFDPNSSPVIHAALSHEEIKDMNVLRMVADNYLRNELIRIEGIADVRVSGEEIAEVMVETDPASLEANNVTSSEIINAIWNFNKNVSGGNIEEMGQKYIIKGLSALVSVSDLENLVVKTKTTPLSSVTSVDQKATSVPLLLKEVAMVSVKNQKPETIVRLNGERCLGISIYKEMRFNTVEAVEKVQQAFRKIKKRLPGYELKVIKNQGVFIQSAIGEVEESALIGIVFAVFVLFLFLRRFGVTLIVSVAIPISVIATFNLMYFNGLTLNVMTLGGLALGAGMLVDNAIVVVENIYRKLEEGLSLKQAAIEGAAGVGGALTASTLTTIVVFLPIVYLHGASGELFKDQAWTVAFSLFSSLVVALILIPLLSNLFLGERKPNARQQEGIRLTWYGHLLGRILEHRKLVILAAILLCLLSGLLIPQIGSEFMPETQSRQVTIQTTLPAGTALEKCDRTLEQMEEMVYGLLDDKIDWTFIHAGPETAQASSVQSLQGENTGYLKLALKPDVEINYSELMAALDHLFTGISGLDVQFKQDESVLQNILGSDEAPLLTEVSGDDLEVLEQVTEAFVGIMRSQGNVYNVKSTFENGAPEVNIKIDRLKAGIYNLEVSAIMDQIKSFLSGKDGGRMELKGEITDISLKMPEVQLNELKNLKIKSGDKNYLLSELAQINIGRSPREIRRNNQKRVAQISAMVTEDKPFDHVVKELEQQIGAVVLPAGVNVKVLGAEQKRKEAFGSLSFALILSIVLVYMVMASQFESLIHPFTILLTIPLAGVGAILAFFFLGKTFNIMAFIGIVMLAGIAVNDSIILVDAINQLKRRGRSLTDAIVEAGEQRIRPILMTSATTILALLPLTFGFGDSAALRAPMAIAVIGGLITSTLLSLVVIPCVYYVFDSVVVRFSDRHSK